MGGVVCVWGGGGEMKLRWLGFSLPLHCFASANPNTYDNMNLFYNWGMCPQTPKNPAAKPQI